VWKSDADSEQTAQVPAEAGGLAVPVQASAAITTRDAMVRWDAEQVLDTEAWLVAQTAAQGGSSSPCILTHLQEELS
jgi:hypothetical protein